MWAENVRLLNFVVSPFCIGLLGVCLRWFIIPKEIVRLCGIVCGAVNRRSGSDRSLRELSFDT